MQNKRLYTFLCAASLGTFLEFFDLALYSFASSVIALSFFPAHDQTAAILATWGIFAVSYLMRPLGAVWFGYLADVISSRRAMVISMGMMASATAAIGCLPTYEKIGILAPILLLLLRIIQSIAVSPEYNLPSVFIKNNQWCQKHFGFVSSISACVTGLAMMSASWVMSQLLWHYSLQDMPEYVWRTPFIIAGLLVGTVGIYLRWNLEEAVAFERPKTVPFKLVITKQTKDFIFAVLIAGYIGCMSYALFSFLIYQLQTVRSMLPGDALAVLSTGALLPATFSLIAGYLSDKFARSYLMLISALVMGFSGYSLFSLLPDASFKTIVTQTCLMLAALGFFAGSFPGYLADLFEREYRFTGSFLAYNLGMSWIGGMSPIFFIQVTKMNPTMPAYVIIGYSALIALFLVKPLVTFKSKSNKMVSIQAS